MQLEIADLHPIGCGVVARGGAGGRIVVASPQLDRIKTQIMGDVVHHPLNTDHALRAAKAAIGGGALQVGLQAVAFNADRGDRIGVVGVQHGAVRHRQRQILRPAAVHQMGEVDPQETPLGIEACAVGDAERMAFAGDDHVVVAVIAHLAGLACQARSNGAGNRQRIPLAFLAAKTAAHAPGLHPHGMHRQTNRLGHLVLYLGRVLGRGIDQHPAIFLRKGKGRLTFQIEMLLPAKLERAFHNVRCGSDGSCGIALLVDAGAFFEPAVCGKRLVQSQKRGFFGVLNLRLACRNAGRAVAGGNHKEQGLADITYRPIRQQRLIMVRR